MAQGDITKVQGNAHVDTTSKTVSYTELTYIEGIDGELHEIDQLGKTIGLTDEDKSDHPDIHVGISNHLVDTDFVLASDYPDGVLSTIVGRVSIDDATLGLITYEEIAIVTDGGIDYRISITPIQIVPAFPSNFGGYGFTDQSQLPAVVAETTNLMWTTEVSNAYIAAQPSN